MRAEAAGQAPDGGGAVPGSDLTAGWPGGQPVDSPRVIGRIAEWTEFHRHVDNLPEEDRAVVDLVFYQGLTTSEAAETLEVPERTIKRRWLSA
jgi:DNA-directed RNA polymerase specialized sigma24 family protein